MPSLDLLLACLLTTAVFAYIPGPAMLYAAARTLAGGRRAGLMAAFGIHLGGYAHVATAAGGLSVLFHAVPPAYLAVKLAGAAYLVWLGLGLLRARGTPEVGEGLPPPAGARRAFLQSVAVEVLNPKTALFFLAFLPQFVDPAASWPVWLQFVVLGTLVNAMFTSADLVCVLLAGAVSARLRRSARVQRALQRAGGAVLVGLGTHLALQRG
ncbi:LysE family translocator [Ancylobacter lacus]|uniref:LysE family translocator n=1 Tax=Ancylobacter lacus TaxID=2579970 RepID=UPI001BD17DE3|nr:LysE family translocator [Ancylobacter lacus]MBS7539231.1 LysE family translocator [Ancylobacter lacus]